MKQPDLGKKISELRLSKSLTQVELAEKCKIGLRTIQRIESAVVTPRSYTVKMIFSCLEYDFNNSLNESDNTPQPKGSKWRIWARRLSEYVFYLFNLKTNTMKKVSIISLVIIFVCAGLFLNNRKTNAQSVDGWFKAGNKSNSYKVGLDQSTYKTGGSSAYIESVENKITGFGTLMQTCNAQDFSGKRIRMTAYIKSENVTEWAGMWLRVDSKFTGKSVSFDNMQDRPIKGSKDWTKYEIIIDVPEESGTLNYGVLISGSGKVWFDDLSFEIVDKAEAKTTGMKQYVIPERPTNTDFEK